MRPDELGAAAAFQDHAAFDLRPTRFEQPALVTLAQNGGLVLGAYDGPDLVGLSISFLGTDVSDPKRPAMANLKMVTPFLGEHPRVHGQSVLYQLLLHQRDFATRQGIRLITWTLDPLNSADAHLSLHLLGAIADQYVPDYFGANGHPTGVGDRLIMEWWVTNRRVEERLTGRRGLLSLQHYLDGNATIMNPSQVDDGWPVPDDSQPSLTETHMMLVEVPADFHALHGEAPALAASWRQHIRTTLVGMLASGYVITDFLHEAWEGRPRSFYVFSRVPGTSFSAS